MVFHKFCLLLQDCALQIFSVHHRPIARATVLLCNKVHSLAARVHVRHYIITGLSHAAGGTSPELSDSITQGGKVVNTHMSVQQCTRLI